VGGHHTNMHLKGLQLLGDMILSIATVIREGFTEVHVMFPNITTELLLQYQRWKT
jgi:hypothetical protein